MGDFVKYTIKQACDILGVELPAEYNHIANEKLSNITSVVNSLSVGGGFILLGKNSEDRALQLKRALEKKPKFIFSGRAGRKLPQLQQVPHVFVDDAYETIVKLSSSIRDELGATVIGVTGSVGKTTTKDLLHLVLSQKYVSGKNYGNRNNTTGIFLSVQKVDKNIQYYVQEYGVAIGNRSMESKIQACMPNAAVITNISDAHAEILGSRENILKEKLKLVTEMKEGSPAFLNYDDALLRNVSLDKHPIISYAVENKDADYYVENLEFFDNHMEFDIVHQGRYTKISMYTVGIHNVGNAVAAMAVAEWAGVPVEKIVEGIALFKTEGIRQSLTNIGGYKLYIDCYNASPVSMVGAIKTIERIPVEANGKRIAVIAEMRSLGERSDALHIEVAEEIGHSNLDLVICFGKESAALMANTIRKYNKQVLYTSERKQLNDWVEHLVTKNDITLYKGSNALLLHKTIDQVYGTSFHFDEHYVTVTDNSFRFKVISEENEIDKTAAIIQYLGTEKEVKLPNSHNGIGVFSISADCFSNNLSVQKIEIPEPVYNIAKKAFYGCVNLKTVILPKSLKIIEKEAFYGCSSIEEIIIPEGTIEIAENAFVNCHALKKVVLPASLGRIGENAFANCNKVVFEFPIGSYAEKYITNAK